MLRILVVAGLAVGLAGPALADEPDSVVTPVRQRPMATAPT